MIRRFRLSKNAKTGRSVNVFSCRRPSKNCRKFCYRFRRTKAQAMEIERRCGFNPGANTGPITWPVQVESYKRNEEVIKEAATTGRLEELAIRLVQQMHHREEYLRWCGTGDLFPELCELVALYALFSERHSFGFSRDPEMLELLHHMLWDLEVPTLRWPHFIGSIDESTPVEDIERLVKRTSLLNGRPALALATWRHDADLHHYLSDKPWAIHLQVIFGIHSSQHKTRTGHIRACPATEGKKIKCVECRRCYGR